MATGSLRPGKKMSSFSLAMLATGLAADDQIVSTMAQGGFLDWASAVTPDPAVVPASSWQPGWLDELASSTFNCPRELAFPAPGQIVFTNSTGGSLGPYAAGTFHVSNPTTGATYHNTAALTIPTGTSAGQGFVADGRRWQRTNPDADRASRP